MAWQHKYLLFKVYLKLDIMVANVSHYTGRKNLDIKNSFKMLFA